MKYLGKIIVRYGEVEFIGDEYAIEISKDLWTKLLSVATKEELNSVLETQLRLEAFEAAAIVQKAINDRFGKAT